MHGDSNIKFTLNSSSGLSKFISCHQSIYCSENSRKWTNYYVVYSNIYT